MKPTRKLKIHSKLRTRRWDHIALPEIRLAGKWLEEAGFKQGEYINIQVAKNKLIISIDKK
ncbi:SymE family type I addiction module toxin [Sphingobacterium chungjuense]|uniref:SymE family type I addiction module toxin n=1 Tax=Sphingobacterium chungjuense TaxID=2675553 RepID=UPI0014079370